MTGFRTPRPERNGPERRPPERRPPERRPPERKLDHKPERKLGRNSIKASSCLPYAVAILSVGLAVAVTRSLLPWLYPTTTPLFFIAVMVSAWYGGLGTGLLATLLSTLAISYFFTQPFDSFHITSFETLLRLGAFSTAAGIISSLNQARRLALQKAQENLQAVQAAMDREQAVKQQLETVLSSISDGFYVLDRDWRYTYVNDRHCEIVGMQRADILGQSVWDLFPPAVDTGAYVQFHQAMRDQTPLQFDYYYAPWNCWYDHRIYPSASGLSVIVSDITERKLAELILVEQKHLLELIATGKPLDACLAALCEAVTRLNPPLRACLLLADGSRRHCLRSIAPRFPASLAEGFESLPLSAGQPWGKALLQSQPTANPDIANPDIANPDIANPGTTNLDATNSDSTRPDSWRKLCLAHGIRACYASPVVGPEPPPWVLLLCLGEPRLPTTWEYQLAEFATQIASIVFERDRSLQALQQSEERFQLATQAMAGMIYDWNVATGQVYRSEGVAGLTGVELAAVAPIDSWWSERMHPQDQAEIADHWQGLLAASQEQSPQSYSYEYRVRHAQGHWIDVWDRGYLVRNVQGCVVRVVGSVTDITERKRIEADLQQSNNRFYTAMRAVEGIVFEWNLTTQAVYRSEGLFQLVGVQAEAAPPTPQWWAERVHPEDMQRLQQAFEEVQARGDDRYQDEYRVWHEAGYWIDVWERGYLQRNSQGEIIGVVGFTTDISQRKQAEAALRQSEERFRRLADAMPQQVWVADAQGNTQYVNQGWIEFTGLTLEQTQDLEAAAQVVHPDDLPTTRDRWQMALAAGLSYQAELRLKHRAGAAYRWFLSRATPIRDEQGKIVQWFGTSTDIEDFKRVEAALRQSEISLQQQTEQLRQANRIKDEFLAVLSHELRSPLNPILGWAKLLQTGRLDSTKTAQALATIERNAKLQSELIEDLLDVSRILQGKLRLNISPVNLAATIRAAIETVRLAAEAKSIQIETHLVDSGNQVLGDPTRLQQVIWNLLSNAVKFTPAGGWVEVRLEEVRGWGDEGMRGERGLAASESRPESGPAPRTANAENELPNAAIPNATISNVTISNATPDSLLLIPSSPHPLTPHSLTPFAQITVRDNGKGIDPAFLPYVFDYFRQEDGTTTRQFGGLGLGLAIVHHLVELHGGTVQAESAGIGQGTTFTVRLPLRSAQTSSAPIPPALSLNLQGVRVLIADDEPDSRELLAVLLEQSGASVIPVASARAALIALIQAPPDMLISDIGMPDMDGYELVQQIRALPPERGGRVPAIALTAYAAEFDQQKALAAGFQAHLSKPVDTEALIQTVAQWVRPR